MMAVTQALRHSIFKRDNQTCQSCGATAPEVKIVVDHVTPKALGGTDQADNLQTLCQPCNAGKGATPPSAALVDAVKADARRHAELMRAAYAILVERIGEREGYENEFLEAYAQDYVPVDWRASIGRFFMMGVPVEIIVDAAEIAARKRGLGTHPRFKYFCGVIWNQVQAVDAVTATKATLEGAFHTAESLEEVELDAWKRGWELGYSNFARKNGCEDGQIYTQYEVDDIRQTSYNEGYSRSYQDTWNQVHERYPGLSDGEYVS